MKLVGTVREMVEAKIISPYSALAFHPDSLVEIMPSEEDLNNFIANFNAPPPKRSDAMSNIAFAMDLQSPKRDVTGMLYSEGTIIPPEYLSKEPVDQDFDLDEILAEVLAGCGEREKEEIDEESTPIFIIALK